MSPILFLALPAVVSAALWWMSRRRNVVRAERVSFDLSTEEWERWPDQIRLLRLDEQASHLPDSLTSMAARLREEGFDDAGIHRIDGVPGITVQLLASRTQSLYATLWHVEGTGVWFEFTCGYPGGQRWTFTSLGAGGFAGRPGDTTVRVPDADLLDLLVRACSERPMSVFVPVRAEQAAASFENRYAMWVMWRRSYHGAEVSERAAA